MSSFTNTNSKTARIGDCEVCDATNIVVIIAHGNILMCESCKTNDDALTTKNKEIKQIVQSSNQVDESIQIKTDLFNAGTVAAIELRGAIDADDTIPADQKDYAYAKLCLIRFQHFQKVVFEQRQELLARENEMRAWQVQTQTAAGKLRSEYRDQFRSVDVSYQPAVVKVVKPASSTGKTGKKKFNKQELFDAAKKFNVPADGVRMVMVSRNMTASTAAEFLARQMGLLEAK
jgi:hypothetical protein